MKIESGLERYLIRNKDLWKDHISQNLPLTLETLSNCSDYLNWHLVSRNRCIHWSSEIIHKFEDKWHWITLTKNKSLYRNIKEIEPLIIKYKELWSWKYLSRIKPELLTENLKHINL